MNRAVLILSCVAVLALGCEPGGMRPPPPGTDGGVPPGSDGSVPSGSDGGTLIPRIDAGGGPPGATQPGEACGCDAQCASDGANTGLCVQGVCMMRATGACSTGGSTTECPAGMRCWGIEGVTGGICWPDCSSFTCAGECDGDGSCIWSDATSCDSSCSEVCEGGSTGGCPANSHPEGDGCACDEGYRVSDDRMSCVPESTGGCPANSHLEGDGCVCDAGFSVSEDRMSCVPECTTSADCSGGDVCTGGVCGAAPCTAGSCPSGSMCSSGGICVIDIGTPPPGSPPSTCRIGSSGIPDWRCTSGCGDLLPFEPVTGPGYDNYPLNGETASDQYRSFIRRDVMMLVKYAAAMTDCQGRGWSFGTGGRLGLGDMSEASGAIPGTREGSPGHPAGTHVNGHDMDVAYFQTGTSNNYLRPVCPHTSGGVEQYHCTGAPTGLDPWRTALFLGHLHASPALRVIGVDGQIGPLIDSALTQLCTDGWVTGSACGRHSITWEATDTGRGWFRFHHHHFHFSVSGS